MPTRADMITALRTILMPVLRQRGFTGSFPHLRRIARDRIDLVSFQFDKWGGGFVVEVARSLADGVTTHWGEKIAPGRVKAQDLHPHERLRLRPKGSRDDHWFRFDAGQPVDAVARDVVSCLEQAEVWWARPRRDDGAG